MIIIKPVNFARRLFSQPRIPREYRRNFIHLFFDIAWFGILSGSAINFLAVYAARLGASGFQIGLIGAVPAVVSLALSIPTGVWLEKRPVERAVFWTAYAYRLGYFLWIPLPWLLGNQGQIWALIAITLLMGIPLSALGMGFNALFAAAVPPEWRAYVAGTRNVLQAVSFMAASLGCGYLLDHVPFPLGYQIVFGIGFLGAAMSTFHLTFIKPLPPQVPAEGQSPVEKPAQPPRQDWRASLRLDIWKTGFRSTLLVLLGFHLAQYLATPLFPLYTVNVLRLNDAEIGLGMALFYLTVFLGSTQLHRIARKLSHMKITGWGVAALSLYPIAMAFSRNAIHYFILSAFGGFAWAMVGGAYVNYLLEKIPENDRPAHLAWYNLILNACVLFGSLAGPFLAGFIGLGTALITIGILRLLAGMAILKWG